MINHLLKNGVASGNIFFLSFEDLQTRQDFDEIVKTYQELVRKVLSKEKEVYFFLDEIQFLKDWSLYLKRYFDKKYPIKFIVSGSAASLIKKNSESLAGRTVEEIILPFNFYEYLNYRTRDEKLKKEIDLIRKGFDFKRLPSRDSLIPYETQIKILWEEYLDKGGFPHLFRVKEKILWEKLLREDVIEKVIYRDLVDLHQIKKPFILENLFLYLAEHSSELLNISNIANSLKLSREYTEKYVEYLKQAYLIFKLKRYSKAVESQIRKMEKCYLVDPGLMHFSGSPNLGKAAETVVARHLVDKELYYCRNNYEIDIVLKREGDLIPIEVKYKNKIAPSDLKGLLKFLDTFKQKVAIVVTKDLLKEEKINNRLILYLPARFFVMLI
jgi:predicted AAA+ superfamily ATPase